MTTPPKKTTKNNNNNSNNNNKKAGANFKENQRYGESEKSQWDLRRDVVCPWSWSKLLKNEREMVSELSIHNITNSQKSSVQMSSPSLQR